MKVHIERILSRYADAETKGVLSRLTDPEAEKLFYVIEKFISEMPASPLNRKDVELYQLRRVGWILFWRVRYDRAEEYWSSVNVR